MNAPTTSNAADHGSVNALRAIEILYEGINREAGLRKALSRVVELLGEDRPADAELVASYALSLYPTAA